MQLSAIWLFRGIPRCSGMWVTNPANAQQLVWAAQSKSCIFNLKIMQTARFENEDTESLSFYSLGAVLNKWVSLQGWIRVCACVCGVSFVILIYMERSCCKDRVVYITSLSCLTCHIYLIYWGIIDLVSSLSIITNSFLVLQTSFLHFSRKVHCAGK